MKIFNSLQDSFDFSIKYFASFAGLVPLTPTNGYSQTLLYFSLNFRLNFDKI